MSGQDIFKGIVKQLLRDLAVSIGGSIVVVATLLMALAHYAAK